MSWLGNITNWFRRTPEKAGSEKGGELEGKTNLESVSMSVEKPGENRTKNKNEKKKQQQKKKTTNDRSKKIQSSDSGFKAETKS